MQIAEMRKIKKISSNAFSLNDTQPTLTATALGNYDKNSSILRDVEASPMRSRSDCDRSRMYSSVQSILYSREMKSPM
jgi:hypothetical protein